MFYYTSNSQYGNWLVLPICAPCYFHHTQKLSGKVCVRNHRRILHQAAPAKLKEHPVSLDPCVACHKGTRSRCIYRFFQTSDPLDMAKQPQRAVIEIFNYNTIKQ